MAYILWQASGEKAHAQAVLVVIRDQAPFDGICDCFQPLLSWSYTRLASISQCSSIMSRACSSMGSLAWAPHSDPAPGHGIRQPDGCVVAAVGQEGIEADMEPSIIAAFHQQAKSSGAGGGASFAVSGGSVWHCSQSRRNATVPRSSRKAAADISRARDLFPSPPPSSRAAIRPVVL